MSETEVFIKNAIEELKEQIQGKAIIACSGGVDSMVSAVLTSKAVGDRLLAVYVDTGLMRKGETEEVRKMLEDMKMNFKIIDAADEFFAALKGVMDPETKRKVIGGMFIKVFEREAKQFGSEYLVQGTIAPDIIESGKDGEGVIKSHHNVGGLPKEMGMTVVEPLRELFKEDVRELARALGIRSSVR
ncbi:MAG: glutamine-hydrolyzing GMP synthase subunit GuaA, partial [Candidatus Methanoplasma sp.]|nr:glutamine-hydrolyzing GMP synthase subunit GuaA [Candidatus Methanoplasma sp.]